MSSSEVKSIIKRGSDGILDGPYTGSANTGGGVHSPMFVESLNSTHLIVVHEIGTVRLIDTKVKEITTLISSSKDTPVSIIEFVLLTKSNLLMRLVT